MDLEVRVDALDIVEDLEELRWSVVDVEAVQRGIAGDIIERVG